MLMFQNTNPLDEGWEIVQRGIDRLKNSLEEQSEERVFSSEELMMLNATLYSMCTQKTPYDYSWQMFDKYRGVFVEYITSTVLPSLKNNEGEFMLRELVKRWQNHKVMARYLSSIFLYLDQYLVPRNSLPTLTVVALTCFRDLVFEEMNGKVRDAVISLIDQEREGRQIDRGLLKNVEDVFVELGMRQQMDDYKRKAMEDSFMNLEVKDSGSREMLVERWAE